MRRSIFLLALPVLAACGTVQQPVPSSVPVPTPPPLMVEKSASLTFEPAAVSLAVGETTDVKVLLDLASFASTTYQAKIAFDPAAVEIIDANADTRGTQIGAGLYATYPVNEVDSTKGIVSLLGFSMNRGEEVTGSGTLLTITLKGKAAGTSTLSFVRDPEAETQVILKDESEDILGTVGTLSVTVTE